MRIFAGERTVGGWIAWSLLALLAGIAPSAGADDPRDPKLVHPLFKGVSNPELIPESKVEPVYPETARREKASARVILQAEVDEGGRVKPPSVLAVAPLDPAACGVKDETPGAPPPISGRAREDLGAEAIRAVKQWRYHPGRMSGKPIAVYFTIIVEFCFAEKDPPRP